MHAWLGEFHPWLMLDDVKDLVNRQPQGVKIGASSVFAIMGKRTSCLLGRDVPSHASVSYWLEGSRVPMHRGYFAAHHV